MPTSGPRYAAFCITDFEQLMSTALTIMSPHNGAARDGLTIYLRKDT
jgi:hypothetical protein